MIHRAAVLLALLLLSCAAPSTTTAPSPTAGGSRPTSAPAAPPSSAGTAPTSAPQAGSAPPTAVAAAGPLLRIVMAETSHNPVYWPDMVATARGFDRAEGIELDYLESRTSADGARLLVSGDAQATSITPDVAILAAEGDPNL